MEVYTDTIAAAIHVIGEDNLLNIFTRLPETSFASAACVSRSWNLFCERLLSRPKLASACSFNHSLKAAVKEVVNKVLSEPIRLHFAIASIATFYEPEPDIYDDDVFSEYAVEKARDLVCAHVPIIVNCSSETIGRDAVSDEFKESQPNLGEDGDSILLIVGFLPGLKVTTIPLLKQIQVINLIFFFAKISGLEKKRVPLGDPGFLLQI
ncbi:putative F-box domain-containing protein [Helianthus annuus]|uniref:F-box domain-containing protein n=1 Tax=Helianthus annuus TaxID=4232 RepID=A0A9K3JKI1_HELAN|nr:putative F-box domain-containing protein [Helianthus annuus]KAJ0938508.1 putative F-box domain-containing protein [Helianthus annuus]